MLLIGVKLLALNVEGERARQSEAVRENASVKEQTQVECNRPVLPSRISHNSPFSTSHVVWKGKTGSNL